MYIFIFSLCGWLKVEVQWWEAKGRNSLSEFDSRLELGKNNIFFYSGLGRIRKKFLENGTTLIFWRKLRKITPGQVLPKSWEVFSDSPRASPKKRMYELRKVNVVRE